MIRVVRTFIILFVFIVLIGSLSIGPVVATGRALPPIPGQTILNRVISETGGPTFTPLNVSQYIMNRLTNRFSGVFDGVEDLVRPSQAVNYITTRGRLKETVIPLRNSRTAVLDPDMTTQGDNPRPGKIIGALFQPSRTENSVMVVVAVFRSDAFNCPECHRPEKLRFYYNNGSYYERGVIWGEFLDANGDNVPEAIDDGAVIAHRYTCLTVGLEQVCWEPYNRDLLRDPSFPRDIVDAAYHELDDVYEFSVDFVIGDAVPDLLGPTVRQRCANQLHDATYFTALSNCVPNAVFTSSKEVRSGQPIAIMSMLRSADLEAYTSNGTYVGRLPVGDYLVMDATPYINTPGRIGVLFLVNSDTVHHYLIPSVVMQGFGSSAIDKRIAGIKDGFAARRSF
jgi:hypothetical protein